jgi:hypothetical protein
VSISDRLRSVIGETKIDEFAELIGEPVHRVKDVLRNKQRPPFDMLVKLRTIQGVDLNWLAVGDGVTGPVLATQEATLLARYRELAPASQEALRSMAAALSMQMRTYPTIPTGALALHDPVQEGAKTNETQMTFHHQVGQVIQGDAHIQKQNFHAAEKPAAPKSSRRVKPHK